MTGYCRIWIPQFGVIAKPLYEALKGLKQEPLDWNAELKQAFHALQKALT